MNVSRTWLQKYFSDPLPSDAELVDMLTFHSSEVDEVTQKGGDTILDIKVLPDRAPYALSHRGIAFELAAALNRPLSTDPLREPLPEVSASSGVLSVQIDSVEKCPRYMAALVEGVIVGPSPDWLRGALESVGQRSINNVVDATNYVMLNIGQPLHAFDASKLRKNENDQFNITVRSTLEGEKITTLTGEDYVLPEDTLVIADGITDTLLGIAGVKGGNAAEVTGATTTLLIEAANFDATTVRRASQALKLWTDASQRFQNKLSPELSAYGMRDVLALIQQVAGGEVRAVIDTYPNPQPVHQVVRVSTVDINAILGTDFTQEDVEGALIRLQLSYEVEDGTFSITPPFERRDVVTIQDVTEEVGRILGYERVTPQVLPVGTTPSDQLRYQGIERIKDVLLEHGYTEVSTQSFAKEGHITLANPLQMDHPALRASLKENMGDALTRAVREAPRVLGPDPAVKLFELGTVFSAEGEHLALCIGYRPSSGKPVAATLQEIADVLTEQFSAYDLPRVSVDGDCIELSLKSVNLEAAGEGYVPNKISLGAYHPFSTYPFATRDIAVWVPNSIDQSAISQLIAKEASDLLARLDLFDRFEKDERTSYAFRLVFQSHDRTLADTDLDPLMQRVTDTLNSQEGWEVR